MFLDLTRLILHVFGAEVLVESLRAPRLAPHPSEETQDPQRWSHILNRSHELKLIVFVQPTLIC